MKRFLLSAAALSLALTPAFAQVKTGTLEFAFGKVRLPDGNYRDLTGLKVPYKLEKIQTTKLTRQQGSQEGFLAWLRSLGQQGGNNSSEAIVSIYKADQQAAGLPDPYGVIGDFSSASVLDDLVPVTGSIGKPWKYLTFGFSTATPNAQFGIRWTIFQNYIGGLGAGVSAVTPYPVLPSYIYDFGVNWNQPQPPGDYKITIDISAAGVSAPTNSIWLASQFRQTFPFGSDGNTPFRTDIANVFNPSLPPQVGQSSINYWLDNPEDFVYDETEIDIFGDTQNPLQGNLLLDIQATTTGQTFDVTPFQIQTIQGTATGGLFQVQFIDNFFYDVTPDRRVARGQAPVVVEVTGGVPQTNLASFGMNVVAQCTQGSGRQRVQFWRYNSGTPGWVTVSDNVQIGNSSVGVVPFWTAGNPSQFVDLNTNEVKARISFFPDPVGRSFRYRLNHTKWTISTP